MNEVQKVRLLVEKQRQLAAQRAKSETARLFFSPEKHLPKMPKVKAVTRYVE